MPPPSIAPPAALLRPSRHHRRLPGEILVRLGLFPHLPRASIAAGASRPAHRRRAQMATASH
jgi:hypothetical protein